MTDKLTGAENIKWNLGLMYSGITDPQIDLDVVKLIELLKNFKITHGGNLSFTLGKATLDLIEIESLSNKVLVFIYLSESTDIANPTIKTKSAEIQVALNTAFGEYLTFFDIELVALDDAIMEDLYKTDPVVAKHKPWLEHRRIFKPYLLSEPVESSITKRATFGSGAWSEFFSELESDLIFKFKDEEKSLTELLHLLTESQIEEERAELLKIINDGLGGMFAKYSAQNLWMVVGYNALENRERGYEHPMQFINLSNRIPDSVVSVLHDSVEQVAGPLARQYYRLKAAHLGLKTLKWSDRNAPMPFSDTTTVTFDESLKTVLDAYQSFSPTLADLIRQFVKTKCIDAPAGKGRRGGAFNYSFVLPDNIPVSFTFLNYLGSNRDTMVLAHELGHGVHGLLAGKAQGTLMLNAPTVYAETASVFGEIITFNFLNKKYRAAGDNNARLSLLMGAIDDVINTMVRQIGFSNFERRLHGMDSEYQIWNKPQKLSVQEISNIFLETLEKLYGKDGEVFTYENTSNLWTYIAHFHRPFYVYGYAFGQLLTHSLYAKQAQLGDRFVPLYLEMLSSGSTKGASELLKPFGFDPTDKKFWIDGINSGLGKMIEEAEQLSHEMGIKF